MINSPVDSTMKYLESYPFNNLNYSTFPKDTILQQLRSLSDSTMETQIDTVKSEQLLDIRDITITQQILADTILITDSLSVVGPDSVVATEMEAQETHSRRH